MNSFLPSIDRNRPVPVAGNKADGPLKLSIHPLKGSRQEALTIDGRIIAQGIFLHSSITKDSAMALVYV